MGHLALDCPRDPNYKTNLNIIEEDDRIEHIQKKKRLNADSNI